MLELSYNLVEPHHRSAVILARKEAATEVLGRICELDNARPIIQVAVFVTVQTLYQILLDLQTGKVDGRERPALYE